MRLSLLALIYSRMVLQMDGTIRFAVALNEQPEVGHCELQHYSHNGSHPSKSFGIYY